MNQRLLGTFAVYGLLAPGAAVGAVYGAVRLSGGPFGPVGFAVVLVGLMAGSLMFARAGTALQTAGGGGPLGEGVEQETTSFVDVGSDTPLKVRVGLFLTGAAVVSALLLAVG